MTPRPTALIADDEPLLRQSLARMLAQAWPELEIVAYARNGREAIAQFEALRPDVCFLDVHMPRISGIEAARNIGRAAHLVFVTAHGDYAIQAFDQGALDYLVKPLEAARLADTVERLQVRLRAVQPGFATQAVLDRLAACLSPPPRAAAFPRWVRASIGQATCMIAVDEIDFLRADDKYTLVAWRGDGGRPDQALLRTSIKELLPLLDPARFVQIHRSVVANLDAISHVLRGDNETAQVYLKHRPDILPVSRSYLHVFRRM